MKETFQLALCQSTTLSGDRRENLKAAAEMVKQAAVEGARIVALPEMFTTPYERKYIFSNSEPADGETGEALSHLAAELGIYLIGGSIPEQEEDSLYNTCLVYGPKGGLIGKYRKAHLFDVDIKGKVRFMESEIFRQGEELSVVDMEFCKVGIGICYDLRFPEHFRKLALLGAELIVLPAAFNPSTGPAHWELTLRARALDNQVYFAGVSPARNPDAAYKVYGHSCVADPWGRVVGILGEGKEILHTVVDLNYLREVREQLPLLKQRQPELYR